MVTDLSVKFCGLTFKNPIVAASGTFGFGREYGGYFDLSELGGIAVKGLTMKPRLGNAPPRIAETPSGMLNAVGLQNPGVRAFVSDELPYLRRYDTKIIANISAESAEEYGELAAVLSDAGVDIIEVNVSCPNVKAGGIQFGTSAVAAAEVTEAVKRRSAVPVMIKLSPNVTDIAAIAKACESAGADALSLINTLLGMRIDVKSRRPVLSNVTGGLSGPAVLPVAVRCVYQAANAVKLPLLGLGGVSSGTDAAELMLAGASLVGVGTASFANPRAALVIRGELEEYMRRNNLSSPGEISGGVVI
ncbi:MAG: dihydroorotate dehydrogenase [Oscillospiraceae bacterium]|jgi:dihydroorotate dehydrogenase (NAD+) catalytic subunit|nr:dihydroorotate dehydrogenase [Oscillospiraceae bacterium]